MHPTLPVDDSNDLVSLIVYIDHNLLNQRPDDTPLEEPVASRMVPHGFEIPGEIFEFFRSDRLDSLPLPLLLDPQFGVPDLLQGLIPPALQFARHQAIVRVCRIKLVFGAVCCIPCGFQFLFQYGQDFVLLMALLLACQHRRFHCRRL